MAYQIGFLMDQIAGHVTNYHNLREVALHEPELNATWHEIHYYKSGGAIENVRERVLPFVPTYFSGISRGAWEIHKALRGRHYDALFSNASVGVFFSRTFQRTPTLIDFDSTPYQIDQMEAYSNGNPDPKPVAQFKWRLSKKMMEAAALLQAWSNWAKESTIRDYGIDAKKLLSIRPVSSSISGNPPPNKVSAHRTRPGAFYSLAAISGAKAGNYCLSGFGSKLRVTTSCIL